MSKDLKNKIKEFFDKLGFKDAVKIEQIEGCPRVNFETEESSFLIGYRGRTLKALARLLRLVLKEEGKGLILDINNYQKEKQERLENMANDLAEKAVSENRPQVLPYMSSYERRIIHLFLQNREDIVSESEGEEPRRRIVIRPKK